MSQQVRVERDLVFAGHATTTPNIKGPAMPEMNILDDHFVTALAYGGWLEIEANGGTIAVGTTYGGTITMTTDGSDNGCAELYRVAHWTAAKNCGMEAKIAVDDNSFIGIAVGFVDQVETDDDNISGELNASNVLRTPANTEDAALFVFDVDGTDYWYCTAINAGTVIATTVVAVGSLAPVNDVYARIRVQTDTAGNVTFYYNGTPVGYLPTAIAYASTEMLTPYIGFIERSASARVLTIDRVTVWQDD